MLGERVRSRLEGAVLVLQTDQRGEIEHRDEAAGSTIPAPEYEAYEDQRPPKRPSARNGLATSDRVTAQTSGTALGL